MAAGCMKDELGVTAGSINDELGVTAGSINDELGVTASSINDELGVTTGSINDKLGVTAGSINDELGVTAGSINDELGVTAGSRKDELDVKYAIKRPTYSKEDLQCLQDEVVKLQTLHPDWFDSWLEESVQTRFLKAFLTVEKTLDALKVYCEWRIKFMVDEISPDDPDIIREAGIGRDQLIENITDGCGRPVVLVYPRLHDSYHNNYDSLYKYIIFQLEQLCSECDRNSDGTFCLIFDLKGFSMQNMDYQCLKKIVWFLRNCYPERLGVCLVINYPWVFYGCWEIIKRWLNDITRSKILFCGEKELRDFIDVDSCPIQLLQ